MAPRAYWTGNVRISLVSFGVRLYDAVSDSERVRLNQVHKVCGSRIKQPPTCPVHGVVDRAEIVKAYEFERDRYVLVEPAELAAIKLRSEKTIEVDRFVPIADVPEVYLDSVYYAAPDGPLAQEPFRVVREALARTKTGAVGRFTLAGRERAVLLRADGKGMTLTTLHTAAEVRSSSPYFEDVAEGPVNPEHLKLAETLVKTMGGEFEAEAFHDRYQDALLALVKSKVEGQEPVILREEDAPATFNFMEALRQSVGTPGAAVATATRTKRGKKPPARSETPATRAEPVRRRKRA